MRTLIIAIALLIPVAVLLAGSLYSLLKKRSLPAILRLVGASLLLIVIAAHICEAMGWLATMGWGLPNSPGHYLDLSSAALGMALIVASGLFRVRKSER